MTERIKILLQSFRCHFLRFDLVKQLLITVDTLSSGCDLQSAKQKVKT